MDCNKRSFIRTPGVQEQLAGIDAMLAELSCHVAAKRLTGLECLTAERRLKERKRWLNREHPVRVIRCQREAMSGSDKCERHGG
jgi:hypothetical protein